MEQGKKLTKEQKDKLIEETLRKWQTLQEQSEEVATDANEGSLSFDAENKEDSKQVANAKTENATPLAKLEEKAVANANTSAEGESGQQLEKKANRREKKKAHSDKVLNEKAKARKDKRAAKKESRHKNRAAILAANGITGNSDSDSKKKAKGFMKVIVPFQKFFDLIGTGIMWIIIGHDWLFGKLDNFIIESAKSFYGEIVRLIYSYRHSRREIWNDIFAVLLLSCFLLLVFDKSTVYEYAYNGRVLGYVDNQEYVTDILDVAGDSMSKNNDLDVSLKADENVTFTRVLAKDRAVDTSDQAVNKFAYMTDIDVQAYGIYENGNFVTVVESEPGAAGVLNSTKAKESIPDEGMTLISADFINEIEIKPIDIMLTSIQSNKNAIKQMTEGGTFTIKYIAKQGDTLSSIANIYSVSTDDLYDADNEKQLNSVEMDDLITIRKNVTPVQVEMVEKGTMTEVVKFESSQVETADLYIGETMVQQEGVDGKNAITGKVTKVNGEITAKDLTKSEVITEVVNEIVLVGTTKKPATVATGVYGMPIRTYIISSEFGYRWGRQHEGIDFAASTGTPIYAADGGTVEIAGVYGGYGYTVQINHGNGSITRYGHCNELYVSVGDKVAKGDNIAAVGNTGNSTGAHLHFEIRVNGTAVDPGPILGVY
ncbi:MAG: peptidoglycan DD-metalloendopeptidase family protein [Clostridiales bacterium]|jgi:murein DD-endopeptidase MepM/ murein hydrolase activator NlpD|nr:peptidoglycan DD-metalloendopeptidase family protein [Clostridiales bacterium]